MRCFLKKKESSIKAPVANSDRRSELMWKEYKWNSQTFSLSKVFSDIYKGAGDLTTCMICDFELLFPMHTVHCQCRPLLPVTLLCHKPRHLLFCDLQGADTFSPVLLKHAKTGVFSTGLLSDCTNWVISCTPYNRQFVILFCITHTTAEI